ncbi:MAG: ATP synthase F1 subunit gamma [Candidatus Omnitrophota bacterium]|nr:ATP synthase F1 subunit gamma [Candidatus Omnitrophota bacterium]
MIQSFRRLKERLKSVDNTRKITRAMQLISAAKLSKAKGSFLASKPYFSQIERVLYNFLSDAEYAAHPLIGARKEKKAIAIMVVASDTGLCSAYNNSIINLAGEFANKFGREKVRIVAVGKEAFSYFRKESYAVENSYLGLRGKFSDALAADITNYLIDMYVNHRSDEVYIAYTHFSSNLRHKPVVEKFLSIEYEPEKKKYYILEPEREVILNDLVSKYLLAKVRMVLLDSLTAEHSARMLAMKIATDNADELIETLTLQKNKARQAAITKEVLEIAMSAEALKD